MSSIPQSLVLRRKCRGLPEHGHADVEAVEDGRIDWSLTAPEIYNRMRGFSPWPGAYTEFRGQTCHLLGKPVSKEKADGLPGTLLAGKEGLHVCCGGGSQLEIISVKQEGRKQISAAEYVRGARLHTGERFGTT